MYTLGVETSCDDTSLAVLRGSARVLSNVVSSSIRFHKKYGGVIPEIASRMHLEIIDLTLKEALKQAQVKLKDIGLVAVTAAPGLKGSLLVGICFARALAFGLNKPLIEVNHLDAHLYAAFLQSQRAKRKFPLLAWLFPGGIRACSTLKILPA